MATAATSSMSLTLECCVQVSHRLGCHCTALLQHPWLRHGASCAFRRARHEPSRRAVSRTHANLKDRARQARASAHTAPSEGCAGESERTVRAGRRSCDLGSAGSELVCGRSGRGGGPQSVPDRREPAGRLGEPRRRLRRLASGHLGSSRYRPAGSARSQIDSAHCSRATRRRRMRWSIGGMLVQSDNSCLCFH